MRSVAWEDVLACQSRWWPPVLERPFCGCTRYFDELPMSPLHVRGSVTRGWKLWLASAFALAASGLGFPILPRWLWIVCLVGTVALGLALVVVEVRRRKASAVESVGLLPTLTNTPPSDMDAP